MKGEGTAWVCRKIGRRRAFCRKKWAFYRMDDERRKRKAWRGWEEERKKGEKDEGEETWMEKMRKYPRHND